MASSDVKSLRALAKRRAAQSVQPPAPGTLIKWEDEEKNTYWEFTGNGETTGTELLTSIIHTEANDDPSFLPVDGNQDVARQVAGDLLKMPGDTAIPLGKTEEISLRELLRLITPFIEAYAKEHVETGESTDGLGWGEQKKTIGAVSSHGLTLPLIE